MVSQHLKTIYKEELNILGEPQTYHGLKLYPINLFDNDISAMMHMLVGHSKKEYIAKSDIKVQKALYNTSYLKTILTVLQNEVNPNGIEIFVTLQYFLSIITKTEASEIRIYFENQKQHIQPIELLYLPNKAYIKIGDQLITDKDFDNIREIILEQNGISLQYIESYQPELEEALRMHRGMTENNITFSDDIFSFLGLLQMPKSEIKDYTLYQFKQQFSRLKMIEEYRALYPLEVSGKIKTKNGIPHFSSHINNDKSRYGEIMVDMEEFENEQLNPIFGSKMGGQIEK